MYEYEFRITVSSDDDNDAFLNRFPNAIPAFIVYAPPRFRWRQNRWETKKKLRSVATYYDGLWFKLIESEEKNFKEWKLSTHRRFIQSVALTQNPFRFENRLEVDLGSDAKLYHFHKDNESHGITFELEIGMFFERWKTMQCHHLIHQLAPFKEIFHLLRAKPPLFTYTLKPCTRKPVKAVQSVPLTDDILVAKKYDGTFGFVYSYPDRICEYWEGNERSIKRGISLGNGIIYGAERMDDGTVILLDVYQVRGLRTEGRKLILTEFLPQIPLPTGYRVQCYYSNKPPEKEEDLPTDGLIFHDTDKDLIFKEKNIHTLDLVYLHGYFLLPNGKKVKCPISCLDDGAVYEIDMRDSIKIVKKRKDRFTGNTKKQMREVYKAIKKKEECSAERLT